MEMSSRRGGYRRGGKRSHSHHHHQNDEHWTVKSIHDDRQPSQYDVPQFASSEQNFDHPTTTAPAKPVLEFIPKNRKYHQNRRNSRWGPGNRRPQAVKDQFREESEVGSLSTDERSYEEGKNCEQSDVGSLSTDARINENGKSSGRGSDIESKKNGNNHENVEVNEEDEERKFQGPASNQEEDVDDVQKRLQELLLSSQEPELSEVQLSINDQAQEDEVK